MHFPTSGLKALRLNNLTFNQKQLWIICGGGDGGEGWGGGGRWGEGGGGDGGGGGQEITIFMHCYCCHYSLIYDIIVQSSRHNTPITNIFLSKLDNF